MSPLSVCRLIALGAVSLAGRAPGGAAAAPAPASHHHLVLVELFTSQGCSSCPAADELVRELPRLGFGRDQVVPLTFHVDYWDELGWRDPFATPAFTARQRQYVASGRLRPPVGEDGLGGAYTPQMIVDGHVHFPGGRRDLVLAEIARAGARPEEWRLAVAADPGPREVAITVGLARAATPAPSAPRAVLPRSWALFVALTTAEELTRVPRGENAGRALAEASVVRVLSPPLSLADAAPDADGRYRVTLAKPTGLDGRAVDVVAFVQATDTGEVIATASMPLRVR